VRLNLFRSRKFDSLGYETALALLRAMAYGGSTNRKAMRQLAERVVATAPEGKKFHAERWLETFRRGHRLKVGTYPATFYTNGETAALDDEIADALRDVEVPPGFRGSDEA
jgi:hypothetical protein